MSFCFLVPPVKVYKKVVKFSFKQQKIIWVLVFSSIYLVLVDAKERSIIWLAHHQMFSRKTNSNLHESFTQSDCDYINNRFLRERGMASTPKMEYQVFLCIFQKNSAMATLGLKEMGKFLWEGREKSLPLSLIHIWRCRRSYACRSRWSPYH